MALWNTLVDGMGAILAFLYSIVPSYGVAIIGLTVLVRLLLFPLTAKQARSMRKMQLVEPEVKKLQAKYKHDRKQLNAEVMKFYKENNVNPLGGCLPLVLQMPIFIALFRVLRYPLEHIPANSKLFKGFCGDLTAKACEGKAKGLEFLGLDLSRAASQVINDISQAIPYIVLIALVVATGFLQFKQTQNRQGSAAQNPQAKMLGTVFPIMFAFISYSLPSGVVLYFFISNLWQIGQQALIFKSLTALPEKSPAASSGDSSVPSPPTNAKVAPDATPKSGAAPKPGAASRPQPAAKPAAKRPAEKDNGSGRLLKRAWNAGMDNARAPGSKGDGKSDGKSGTTRRSEAKGRPAVERPQAGGEGTEGFGRAQPSGSRPRPKKRRR